MPQAISTNTFGVAKWVVSPNPTQGTHTTISGALAVAVAGDTIWIRDGTYVENLTLISGVLLQAESYGAVIISGTLTYTGGVSSVLLKDLVIGYQTGSSALVFSGTTAGGITCYNCNFGANNATILDLSNSGGSSCDFNNCFFTAQGTASVVNMTGPSVVMNRCGLLGTQTPLTPGTITTGFLSLVYCSSQANFVTSGTAQIFCRFCSFGDSGSYSDTWIDHGSSGQCFIEYSAFRSSTGTCVNVASGSAAIILLCDFESANTNAISGTGNVSYGLLLFRNSSGIQPTLAPFTVRLGTFSTSVSEMTSIAVGDSPYTVLPEDTYLSVDSSGGAVTLLFPDTPQPGQEWTVKDATGSAFLSNITLTSVSGVTPFDAGTAFVLNINYASINIIGTATPTYQKY